MGFGAMPSAYMIFIYFALDICQQCVKIGYNSPSTFQWYSVVMCMLDNKPSGDAPFALLNAVIITHSTYQTEQSSLLSSIYVTWANIDVLADSLLSALEMPIPYMYNVAEFDHHYACSVPNP